MFGQEQVLIIKMTIDDSTEISLFGVTFKPAYNLAFKIETGDKDGR